MSQYTALLCDLDDTLFDHAHATRRALGHVLDQDSLAQDWPLDEVERQHNAILEVLHLEVLEGRRTVDAARVERFQRLLTAFDAGASTDRAVWWAGAYRTAYERHWRAVPGAMALLATLRERRIPVAVVTNNIRREQALKLDRCGFTEYVGALVTSEDANSSKPASEIFQIALDRIGVPASRAVMFGDGWSTDIAGALAHGLGAVWFNPRGLDSPDSRVPEIRSLEPAETVLERLDLICT